MSKVITNISEALASEILIFQHRNPDSDRTDLAEFLTGKRDLLDASSLTDREKAEALWSALELSGN